MSGRGKINWLLVRLHRAVFIASRGRLIDRLVGMDVLMLTTTGRRSGRRRQTMLTVPLTIAARAEWPVLVASNGGNPRPPDWFVNLGADPTVEVLWRGRCRPMRARVAAADERSKLWTRVVAAYAGYARYQARSPREIPLVVLEPID